MPQEDWKLPAFYCLKTLMGFAPAQDLNRVTLHGPDSFEHVLFEMNEPRAESAQAWGQSLAHKLNQLWEKR